MLLTDKQAFIKNLEERGLETVKRDIINEKYSGEYLKTAKIWIDQQNGNKSNKVEKRNLTLRYLALIFSLIIATAAIINIIEYVSS